jgi:hypothetical protein
LGLFGIGLDTELSQQCLELSSCEISSDSDGPLDDELAEVIRQMGGTESENPRPSKVDLATM